MNEIVQEHSVTIDGVGRDELINIDGHQAAIALFVVVQFAGLCRPICGGVFHGPWPVPSICDGPPAPRKISQIAEGFIENLQSSLSLESGHGQLPPGSTTCREGILHKERWQKMVKTFILWGRLSRL